MYVKGLYSTTITRCYKTKTHQGTHQSHHHHVKLFATAGQRESQFEVRQRRPDNGAST